MVGSKVIARLVFEHTFKVEREVTQGNASTIDPFFELIENLVCFLTLSLIELFDFVASLEFLINSINELGEDPAAVDNCGITKDQTELAVGLRESLLDSEIKVEDGLVRFNSEDRQRDRIITEVVSDMVRFKVDIHAIDLESHQGKHFHDRLVSEIAREVNGHDDFVAD